MTEIISRTIPQLHRLPVPVVLNGLNGLSQTMIKTVTEETLHGFLLPSGIIPPNLLLHNPRSLHDGPRHPSPFPQLYQIPNPRQPNPVLGPVDLVQLHCTTTFRGIFLLHPMTLFLVHMKRAQRLLQHRRYRREL